MIKHNKDNNKIWNKKGALSLEFMIAGVILLVVLVVIIFIFTKGSSKVGPAIYDCVSNGGQCSDKCNDRGPGRESTFYECPDKDDTEQVCCVGECLKQGGNCVERGTCDDEKIYGSECTAYGLECCK